MRTVALAGVAVVLGLLAVPVLSAAARAAPAAPATFILELNPRSASPAPHMINYQWLVAEDAAGYGWEVEQGFPAADGTIAFAPFLALAPGLTFPGDFANVIDTETPPGVEVCFRVRAVAPGLPASEWSEPACGDLAQVPPPVDMGLSAVFSAFGATVSWEPQPGVDFGYHVQQSRFSADGSRDWLGGDFVAPGPGRLSGFTPVGGLPARLCFRVLPLIAGAVNSTASEELCLDYPGADSFTPTPTPTPTTPATPRPPATGSVSATGPGLPRYQAAAAIGAALLVTTGVGVLALRKRRA
jgi:hypothetical protein